MIYLAHYELSKDNKVTEKQGMMTAGNPTEAIQKVSNLVGIKPPSSEKDICIMEGESRYSIKTDFGLHKIQVCFIDKMMTLREDSV